jgi:hypothetical protein
MWIVGMKWRCCTRCNGFKQNFHVVLRIRFIIQYRFEPNGLWQPITRECKNSACAYMSSLVCTLVYMLTFASIFACFMYLQLYESDTKLKVEPGFEV